MELNIWLGIGKVVDTPKIGAGADGKKMAYFELLVNNRVQDANGQWVSQPSKVPILVKEPKVNAVEQYVVKDQELRITGYYVNFMQQNQSRHCIVATDLSFGFKPKDSTPKEEGGGIQFPI
jgi:hypothetical protein